MFCLYGRYHIFSLQFRTPQNEATRTFNNLIIDEELGTSVPNGTFKIESAKLIIDYMILDSKQQKEYLKPDIDRFYLITHSYNCILIHSQIHIFTEQKCL